MATTNWPRILPKNAVASMFQLEHSRAPQDFIAVVQALSEWLTAPAQRALNEELTRWVRMILLAKRLPGIELEEITCLQELNTMLAKRIDEWTTQWQTEGWSKGQAEGRAEGQQEAQLEIARKLRQAGIALDLIVNATGLTPDMIQSLPER